MVVGLVLNLLKVQIQQNGATWGHQTTNRTHLPASVLLLKIKEGSPLLWGAYGGEGDEGREQVAFWLVFGRMHLPG